MTVGFICRCTHYYTAQSVEIAVKGLENFSIREDIRAMIGLAQTQSFEMKKVSLSHSGRTTVECPFCEKRHYTAVPRNLHNKPVRAKCECGKSFPVLFDSRSCYRKEIRLPGEYRDTFGQKDLMTVTTLSMTGAGIEVTSVKPFVRAGETIQLKFMLNGGHNRWIETKAVVRRVDSNRIGVEFVGLSVHQEKCLGFYLMP